MHAHTPRDASAIASSNAGPCQSQHWAPFLRPLRALGTSFHPPRVLLGLLLVAAIMAGGSLWDAISSRRVVYLPAGAPDATAQVLGSLMQMTLGGGATVPVGPAFIAVPAEQRGEGVGVGVFAATTRALADGIGALAGGVVALEPRRAVAALRGIVIDLPAALWRSERGFLLGFGLIATALVAVVAGGLCRMCAVQSATDERLRAVDGLLYGSSNWLRLLLAPLIPALVLGCAALFMMLVGAVRHVPALDLVVALLHGLWLIVGLMAAFIAITAAIIMPVLFPALACENDDAIDAVQRCVSYLVARPLHLILLYAVAIAGVAASFFVVATFAAIGVEVTAAWLTTWGPPSAGLGVPPEQAGRWSALLATIEGFWTTLLLGLVAGWLVSALCTAFTQVYLSLREFVDGEDPGEVWRAS